MKERPILFSGPMMRANMNGSKWMTRRTSGLDDINSNPGGWFFNDLTIQGTELYASFSNMLNGKVERIRCPYGKPGDLLWARETWQPGYAHKSVIDDPIAEQSSCEIVYKADGKSIIHQSGDVLAYKWTRNYSTDGDGSTCKWKPSIHMPRWACRFEAVNIDVRIERLHDFDLSSSFAEGCISKPGVQVVNGKQIDAINYTFDDDLYVEPDPIWAFRRLWISINGRDSWESNPWVWVISYDNPRRKNAGVC